MTCASADRLRRDRDERGLGPREEIALQQIAAEVDEYALSFELGAAKPDPRIFTSVLGRLGVRADEALMIGDSEENDGAARELGCDFALVDPLPVAERPTGLIDALRERGLSL